ncbi:MAG: hypothetical protein M3Y69_01955, partial [Verrucomicrobiota bacterium]|nr:hypothetical protein [Verrucomicrobiota bacterium]
MLDQEDLKWIASASTELNSMLQQVSRYSDLARQHKGEHNYIEMLGERVELASKKAQELFDHVTSKILAGSAARNKSAAQTHAPFSIVPNPEASAREPLRAVPDPVQPAAKPKPPAVLKKKPLPPALGPIPPEIPILNAKGNRELILLVDDEGEIAELASDMLADDGYRVVI